MRKDKSVEPATATNPKQPPVDLEDEAIAASIRDLDIKIAKLKLDTIDLIRERARPKR